MIVTKASLKVEVYIIYTNIQKGNRMKKSNVVVQEKNKKSKLYGDIMFMSFILFIGTPIILTLAYWIFGYYNYSEVFQERLMWGLMGVTTIAMISMLVSHHIYDKAEKELGR